MKKRCFRLMAVWALCCLLAPVLAGCWLAPQQVEQPSMKGEQEPARDSITIATMSEPPSLSPTGHNSVASNYMNLLTYSTLFRIDMNMMPQPFLCEKYETLSDTRWQFTLRKGVKFHDGTDLTAQDVKASLEWAKGFPQVKQYTDSVGTVTVVDTYTIEINTAQPAATLLADLSNHANSIVPKHLIESGNDFSKNPIGSGPYRFTNWVLGDRLEFCAFEEYFGGTPAIANMTWRVMPQGAQRTVALETGQVDFIVEVENADAQRLKNNLGIRVLEFQSTGPTWLLLNNEAPGLNNVDVRRAITCAIDRQRVIAQTLDGMGQEAIAQVPTNLPGYSQENALGYDVAAAKAYMERSGVDPASLDLEIICSSETKARAAQVIAENLSVLGITCRITSMDLATYLAMTNQGNYTAAIGGYTDNTMLGYMMAVFHSKAIGSSNRSRLNDPQIDALLEDAAITVDAQARREKMQHISALLNERCPGAPLYQPVELRAYHADLEGVQVNPSGQLYFEHVSWKAQS